jgi:putative acetyltransferase
MNIVIRDALMEDAGHLCKAEQFYAKTPGQLASLPEELQDKLFEQAILKLTSIKNGKYIVAAVDGEIVGHALLEPLQLKATHHVVQLTIVTHHGWQDKGIGRAMLTHLIDWARSNPLVERIELRVRSINSRAIELYKKVGFKEEGRFVKRIKTSNGYIDDISMALFVN